MGEQRVLLVLKLPPVNPPTKIEPFPLKIESLRDFWMLMHLESGKRSQSFRFIWGPDKIPEDIIHRDKIHRDKIHRDKIPRGQNPPTVVKHQLLILTLTYLTFVYKLAIIRLWNLNLQILN